MSTSFFLFSPYKYSSLRRFAPTWLPLLGLMSDKHFPFTRKSFHLCPENLSSFCFFVAYTLCCMIYFYGIYPPWKSFHLCNGLYILWPENLSTLYLGPLFCFHLTMNLFPPCPESVSTYPWKSFHLTMNSFPPLSLESLLPQGFQPPVNKNTNKKLISY